SPQDFAAHALNRPPRKKPGQSSPPGPPPAHDQQKLRNTRGSAPRHDIPWSPDEDEVVRRGLWNVAQERSRHGAARSRQLRLILANPATYRLDLLEPERREVGWSGQDRGDRELARSTCQKR